MCCITPNCRIFFGKYEHSNFIYLNWLTIIQNYEMIENNLTAYYI